MMEEEWTERYKEICQQVACIELKEWQSAQGYFYWNYELNRDMQIG